MTIAVRTFDGSGASSTKDPAEISELIKGDDVVVWVDLLDPTDDDFACLIEEFSLHPLAIEDVRERNQRPKLDEYPDHAFLVAYSKQLAEVDLFIGPNWLVSVRERNEAGDPWELKTCQARIERASPEKASVGFLVHSLLDELVDGYFEVADAYEDRVEAFEERILTEQLRDEGTIQSELLGLRRELVHFRRVVTPLRDVLGSLIRGDVDWVDEPTRLHLQDVFDHVLRAIDQLDSQRELVGNAVDAHLAIISNRMNFDHMPELGWRFGYPFALGVMVLITLGGYRFFSKRDWL